MQRHDTALTTNVRTHQLANGKVARDQMRMPQYMREVTEEMKRTMENILKRDMDEDLQANDFGPGFEYHI
jgi:hypothetical protein